MLLPGKYKVLGSVPGMKKFPHIYKLEEVPLPRAYPQVMPGEYIYLFLRFGSVFPSCQGMVTGWEGAVLSNHYVEATVAYKEPGLLSLL